MNKIERIKELVELLNNASDAYYVNDKPIMSDKKYDELYDELEALEKETGYVLPDSPTARPGYEVLSELPKERHEKPMLSYDEELQKEAEEAEAKA